MRIVLINQFYPPDLAPTGVLLRDLALELARGGDAVTVVCSRQRYAGDRGAEGGSGAGVEVCRVGAAGAGRTGIVTTLLRYLGFHAAVHAALRRMQPAPDVVVAMTTPPLIGVTAQAAVPAGCRHVQWVMDLYPQVLAAHGGLGGRGLAYRGLLAVARRQWRRCAVVVAPGPAVARRVRMDLGGGNASRVESIPLWAPEGLGPWPEDRPNPLRARRGWGDDELVLLYSGNMGLGHSVTPWLQAALELQGVPGLRWAFAGQGRREAELRAFVRNHPEARVECLPYVDETERQAHLCSGDVHLVSLKPAWSDVMLPSKLQAAFAVGRPVIFAGSPDSDPAAWVRESRGGWQVADGDIRGLCAAVLEARARSERERRGRAALAYGAGHFARRVNCARLAELVHSCN